MAGGRVPFTEEDDAHLVEYLSNSVGGRKGNRLWQDLVNQPKKWPWSVGHSWQSWRTRYRNNCEEFDQKILRHQKRKAKRTHNQSDFTPSSSKAPARINNSNTSTKSTGDGEKQKQTRKADDLIPAIETLVVESPSREGSPFDQLEFSAPTTPTQPKTRMTAQDNFFHNIRFVPVNQIVRLPVRRRVPRNDGGEGSSCSGALSKPQSEPARLLPAIVSPAEQNKCEKDDVFDRTPPSPVTSRRSVVRNEGFSLSGALSKPQSDPANHSPTPHSFTEQHEREERNISDHTPLAPHTPEERPRIEVGPERPTNGILGPHADLDQDEDEEDHQEVHRLLVRNPSDTDTSNISISIDQTADNEHPAMGQSARLIQSAPTSPVSSSQSPSWVSSSDLSRMINIMVETMAERYQFPPSYVLRIWKRAGDLDKAESILNQLRDIEGALLSDSDVQQREGSSTPRINTSKQRNVGEEVSPSSSREHSRKKRRTVALLAHSVDSTPAIRSPLRESTNMNHYGEIVDDDVGSGSGSFARPICVEPASWGGEFEEDGDRIAMEGVEEVSPSGEAGLYKADQESQSDDDMDEVEEGPLEGMERAGEGEDSFAVPLSAEMKRVFALAGSPESKRILRTFWRRYGREFLESEQGSTP